MPKKSSNSNDKRLEILGVLFLAISTFVIISMLGHDTNEELSISPNAKINNPMGILGVLVSHLLIKLGFGYTSLVIPLLCAYWGWVFFSKIEIEEPLKVSFYALISMLLTSITLAIFSIHYNLGPSKFHYSGLLAGLLGDFFLDMFSIYGSLIFITASYLMIVRAYFDLDFYKPFQLIKAQIIILRDNFVENRDLSSTPDVATIQVTAQGLMSDSQSYSWVHWFTYGKIEHKDNYLVFVEPVDYSANLNINTLEVLQVGYYFVNP